MGISVEILRNSHFSNFLIPGIFLFGVIGLGNIISAVLIRSGFKFRLYVSALFSWALGFWIVVQCIMLNSVQFLHVLYFLFGVVEVIISTRLIFKEKIPGEKPINNIL